MARTHHIHSRGLGHFLKTGGVIGYPTESIFGLGCDPRNRRAVQRILHIKRRPQRKGLILIADKLDALKPYLANLSEAEIKLMETSWQPGRPAHTWLVPTAADCPKWLTGRHKSIAVRVTHHPLAAQICKNTGMVIVSTSANRSGHQPAKSTRQCLQLFHPEVRVLTGMTGKAKKPSTIQDLVTGRFIRR